MDTYKTQCDQCGGDLRQAIIGPGTRELCDACALRAYQRLRLERLRAAGIE